MPNPLKQLSLADLVALKTLLSPVHLTVDPINQNLVQGVRKELGERIVELRRGFMTTKEYYGLRNWPVQNDRE